jgi:large subunit ribosomal protein L11
MAKKKKKIVKLIKLHIPAGKANPAPPIGPALGAAGLNIMGFCQDFNAKTKDQIGSTLPTVITVYADKTYDFITKKEPMPLLIMKKLNIKKGSGVPNRDKVGQITMDQAKEVAVEKMPDLNARNLDAAIQIVLGTARSMGVDLVGAQVEGA